MKIDFKQWWNVFTTWANRHKREIATASGIAVMAGSLYSVHKSAPILKEKLDANPEMTRWEKAKTVASVYWPSALAFASATGLILWAHRIQSNRIVAATSATIFAQNELRKFQEAAVEKVGSDAVKEIKERVAEKKAEETPTPTDQRVLTMAYLNKQLYCDEISGRKFFCNDDIINNAVNELNGKMIRGMDYISLNEWWTEIGLEPTTIGTELGWSVYNGSGQLISVDTSYRGTDKETGAKYILLTYNNPPRFDYEG